MWLANQFLKEFGRYVAPALAGEASAGWPDDFDRRPYWKATIAEFQAALRAKPGLADAQRDLTAALERQQAGR